ncbi:MAG: cyclic nucleotide-binding domain-containing protein [Desulfosarcina sp.]|nr:cyclic nucleotide-binding domain-containing protein [Desulfobacterales bacterium]
MENIDQMEEEVDRLVEANDTAGAVKRLFELIEQQARAKNFPKADTLRERLMAVDDMALTEIIKSAEIIEAAKSSALDRDHVEIYAALYDNLNEEETNALFFGMQSRKAESEEVIYRQGEANQRLFFLNQGQLNLYFTREGKDSLISVLEPGAIAGQDSFFVASFATTSLAVPSQAAMQVLDFSTVEKWKENIPGLVDKLEQFCRRRRVGDLVAAKGLDRRSSRRIKVEGQIVAQILDDNGQPVGKPFRGDLADLSNTGLAFYIKATDRAARLLLGRKLQGRFSIRTPGKDQTLERKGRVVAVNTLYIGDYSIHLRFDTALKSN